MRNSNRIVKQIALIGLAVAMVFAVYETARSASRVSASYSLTVEALTGAGGAAASASYQLPDSATAESAVAGRSASASYALQMGVVQNWAGEGVTPTPTPPGPTPTPGPTPPPSTGWFVK